MDAIFPARIGQAARAALAMIGLLLVSACGQSGPPAATQTVPASPGPPPTRGAPTAAPTVAGIWLPPVPERLGGDVPTPTPRPEPKVLTYEVYGLLVNDHLEVQETGVAYFSDYGRLVATMTLSEAEVAELGLLGMRAGFASADEYIEEDPPGVVAELPDRYIGLPGGRRISLRGEAGAPAPLLDLERRLADLGQRVRAEGVQAPRRLIGYWLVAEDDTYGMEIDYAGTVFFNRTAAGVLPADELEELLAQVTPERIAGWERRYPPNERAVPRVRPVIIITYQPDSDEPRDIRPGDNLPLPPSLEGLLARLADIYTRYHP